MGDETPPPTPTAQSTRQRVLEATATILRRDGAGMLTLDAVAREAGISKGGVLYHYGTKNALIQALIDQVFANFEADLNRAIAAEPDAPAGGALRAYVRVATKSAPPPNMTAGLFAVFATDPTMLTTAVARFQQLHNRALTGVTDQELASIVRIAADGLWLTEWLGVTAPTGADRSVLVDRLITLANQAADPRSRDVSGSIGSG